MKPVEFHREAALEASAAALYYEGEREAWEFALEGN